MKKIATAPKWFTQRMALRPTAARGLVHNGNVCGLLLSIPSSHEVVRLFLFSKIILR